MGYGVTIIVISCTNYISIHTNNHDFILARDSNSAHVGHESDTSNGFTCHNPHKIYIISCLAGREFRMGEEFGSGEG